MSGFDAAIMCLLVPNITLFIVPFLLQNKNVSWHRSAGKGSLCRRHGSDNGSQVAETMRSLVSDLF
jgi:hypothetical protein